MDAAGLYPIEPDAGRYHAHLDGSCGHPAALGSSAGDIPADVRPGILDSHMVSREASCQRPAGVGAGRHAVDHLSAARPMDHFAARDRLLLCGALLSYSAGTVAPGDGKPD